MAKSVDQIIVEIKAETKKLTQGLDNVNKKLDKTKKTSDRTTNALKKIGAVVATLGLGKLITSSVATIRTFEDLEATLRAVTGGAEQAALSFEVIREFTKGTTFQIDQVAESFIRLKQAGVVPTSEVLQDFGNLSAGMGKSITQLAQAAFNATTGEMEMLKQFGIKAKLEGNTIVATFDGVTKTIDRSGDSIIEYLRSLGRENFPTAIEERLNTLSGAISNLGDASSEFQVAIGEGGLKDSLTVLAKEFTRVLSSAEPLANMIGSVLGGAFSLLGGAVILVLDNLKLLVSAMIGIGSVATVLAIQNLSLTFATLAAGIAKTFYSAAALLGLAGPIAWKNIAGAVIAASAAYAVLTLSIKQSAKASKTKEELDDELIEKVTVTKDVIKELTAANKDLVASFGAINTEVKTTVSSLIAESGGVEGVQQTIEDMYATFRESELDAMRKAEEKIPDGFFNTTGSLRTEDLEFDKFREEFYQKQFGKSGEEVRRILDIAMVAPVNDALAQVMDAVNVDVDPIQALRDVFSDKTALSALYSEAVALKGYKGSLDDFTMSIRDFITLTDTKLTGAEETLKSIFDAGAASDIDVVNAAIEGNAQALEDVYNKLMLVDDEFKKLGLTQLEFVAQFNKGKESLVEGSEDLSSTFMETLAPAIQSMSLSFANEFADSLLSGQASLQSFRDFSKNIVSQIIAIFIQMAVVNKILKSIFGSSGFGIEGFDDLNTIDLFKKAGGGKIQGGTATLVGERGPEIFVPNTGGTIMNNMNSKNAMGGGGTTVINQSINFATGIVPTVRAEVMKMMPQIADVTKAAVQESAMRGGSFRRSLQGG